MYSLPISNIWNKQKSFNFGHLKEWRHLCKIGNNLQLWVKKWKKKLRLLRNIVNGDKKTKSISLFFFLSRVSFSAIFNQLSRLHSPFLVFALRGVPQLRQIPLSDLALSYNRIWAPVLELEAPYSAPTHLLSDFSLLLLLPSFLV